MLLLDESTNVVSRSDPRVANAKIFFSVIATHTMECAKCVAISRKCTVKTMCNDCVTCPKCISIRQNCKMKTMCNKCKETAKIAKCNAEHKADVEALKEKVKTEPKALLTAGDCWSKDAILTAIAVDCSIAQEVKRIYPTKRCYTVHAEYDRAYITVMLDDAIREQQRRQEEIDAVRRVQIIQTMVQEANELAFRINGLTYVYHTRRYIMDYPIMREEHWLEAVQKHPGILQFTPIRYRTYDICLAAMHANTEDALRVYHTNGKNFPLRYVPDTHATEEMCLAAAAWCNRALWFWPSRHRNHSMYLRATQLNPSIVESTMPHPFCLDMHIRAAAGLGPVEPSYQSSSRWNNLPDYSQWGEGVKVVTKELKVYVPTEKDVKDESDPEKVVLDCAICLEDYKLGEEGVCQLDCKHILHKACITEWLKHKK